MKKLLSVTVLLALVFALVPVHASAGLRGVWDPISNGGPFFTGVANGAEQPALRQGLTFAFDGHANLERYLAFTTRSTVVGSETSRSIWLARNISQIGFRVGDILEARSPMLIDPTAAVSYLDPAWSHDGKYLAYVQSDKNLTSGAIYVQEFAMVVGTAAAATPIGAPLLVVPASPGIPSPRHPSWKPDNSAICFSMLGGVGLTPDIWTVDVDAAGGIAGVPTRITTDDANAEVAPDWGPGNQIVYATNKFGRNVLEIIDLDDMSIFLAESNFANVSHNNPSWTVDGASIYYDAPQNEDLSSNSDIWKLDLASQSKCDLFLDNLGDSDPDVSPRTNTTVDGIQYNTFLCSSIAAGFGQCVWRGTPVTCAPSLPMGVDISPTTLNLGSQGNNLTVTCTFPPETKAAGYTDQVDLPEHGPGPSGGESVKNRRTVVLSPTVLGLAAPPSPIIGSFAGTIDNLQGGGFQINMVRRTIAARLVALGLVNQLVPVEVTAYSSSRGRNFRGFGYLRLAANSTAGQAIRMEQNYPNPFNPVTKISFATAKAGHVNVRIFNVRGELVKTIASGHYGAGSHEATWDGSTVRGKAPTGVYFAKASVRDDKGVEVTSDVIKMVMTK